MSGPKGNLSFLVSTIDISAGRGDLYVALGMARALGELGYGVSVVPKSDWGLPGRLAENVIVMLPHFDVRTLPARHRAIAWVRNETSMWVASGTLHLFDAVMASSELSRAELQKHVEVTVGTLAIAADTDLFVDSSRERTVNVTTTAHHWGTAREVHRAIALAPHRANIQWFGVTKSSERSLNRWNKGTVSFFELPAKYQKSVLVIDDLNHTTKPFGSHNSRLFEALASGALPVTNTALGLAELGLKDLPVYRSANELLSFIERTASDPAGAKLLAQRLRDVVVQRHSYSQRALEFDLLFRQVSPPRTHAKTIGFFPDYRSTNPFQGMMYCQAVDRGYNVLPVSVVDAPVPRDSGESLEGYVLHVHWANPILQGESDPIRALSRFGIFKRHILDIRARGGRLVWTIHNAMPHEFHHYYLELELHRFLADQADLIHIMGEHTFEATKNYYHVPPSKSVVIPHASYIDIYPDFIGRTAARKRLGLQEEEIVLLCMGGIRPYKGLDSLFEAVDEISAGDPRVRLLIAGKPGKTTDMKSLTESISSNRRIKAQLDFISDADLQVWLRAADIAVLPYTSILNSGSFHLAATFGLPIVAPHLGQIVSSAELSYVSSYGAGTGVNLADAIRNAIKSRSSEMSASAVQDSCDFTSVDMSNRFFDAIAEHL